MLSFNQFLMTELLLYYRNRCLLDVQVQVLPPLLLKTIYRQLQTMKLFKNIFSWFKPDKLQVSQNAYDLVFNAIKFAKDNNKELYMYDTVSKFDENGCGSVCCLYGWLPGWHQGFIWTPESDYSVSPSWWDFSKTLSDDDFSFINSNFLFDGASTKVSNKKLKKELYNLKMPNHIQAQSINFVEQRFNEIMKHVEIIPNKPG
jgi:hypothetical protein